MQGEFGLIAMAWGGLFIALALMSDEKLRRKKSAIIMATIAGFIGVSAIAVLALLALG